MKPMAIVFLLALLAGCSEKKVEEKGTNTIYEVCVRENEKASDSFFAKKNAVKYCNEAVFKLKNDNLN